eukprot:CAMPEP_0177443104 /NCGR_PEP_ID=MMETSP0369-20130122/5293_1 /TAXON_ID=447022 ORGANISM="Scrippsiella hangoei-like, Strain SHHI-4" /NCGR_SAMPLE_ID=MMETSP0369 /ASSEMBLY_ACC=CAM_ASM_000364 /LENGTH=476 /DNA_ID=CAMNT_0018915081 /DNA_START=64 /DNA_END=1491 /DNA_ORIENTATION=-
MAASVSEFPKKQTCEDGLLHALHKPVASFGERLRHCGVDSIHLLIPATAKRNALCAAARFRGGNCAAATAAMAWASGLPPLPSSDGTVPRATAGNGSREAEHALLSAGVAAVGGLPPRAGGEGGLFRRPAAATQESAGVGGLALRGHRRQGPEAVGPRLPGAAGCQNYCPAARPGARDRVFPRRLTRSPPCASCRLHSLLCSTCLRRPIAIPRQQAALTQLAIHALELQRSILGQIDFLLRTVMVADCVAPDLCCKLRASSPQPMASEATGWLLCLVGADTWVVRTLLTSPLQRPARPLVSHLQHEARIQLAAQWKAEAEVANVLSEASSLSRGGRFAMWQSKLTCNGGCCLTSISVDCVLKSLNLISSAMRVPLPSPTATFKAAPPVAAAALLFFFVLPGDAVVAALFFLRQNAKYDAKQTKQKAKATIGKRSHPMPAPLVRTSSAWLSSVGGESSAGATIPASGSDGGAVVGAS